MKARPRFSSPIPANSTSDTVGARGAAAMAMHPVAVQRRIYHLLEAQAPDGSPLYPAVSLCIPRRAGKSDGLLSLAVGRCMTYPGYRVAVTQQSGIKARSRFLDTVRALHRGGVGGFTAYRARGEEAIWWDNGSLMNFLPPLGSSFRGDHYHLVVCDEAQEVSTEAAADLVAAILPTMDTHADSQWVVSGTAGPAREGLLFESLESGRAGIWGILEFSAPDDFDVDDESRWLDIHPGPAGVSPERALEVLRMRHAQMPEMFSREYMGIWDDVVKNAVFPVNIWNGLGVDLPPARPARYGLALDITPSGDHASVCVAWRSGLVTWVGVLQDADGLDWVAPYVASLAMADRLPVYADSTPWTNVVMAQVGRDYRRVQTHTCTTTEYAKACALLATEVQTGTLRHSKQPALNDAVAVASRRPITDGGWGFGRRKSSGSISALVGCSVALLAYDSLPAQRLTRALSASVG